MSFNVYPAIDVRGGRVVRLRQGAYDSETRYPHDALELASTYAAAGARWLHLVDLDAARTGCYSLFELLSRIVRQTSLTVQTGGGVREARDVDALLDAGASRVVVGSLAVRSPETVCALLERHGPERITIALDTRQDAQGRWQLPVHGWTEGSGRALDDIVSSYRDSELRHVLCTDIGRDGMLAGPNLALYEFLGSLAPRWQIQASGGVREVADIAGVRAAGLAGVVLGRALLDGLFTLEDALTC